MTPNRSDICAVLRSEILDGKYDGYARFPSEPSLARRFGVSRSTITRALDRLKHDGLLVSRKGSGSRVRFERLGGSRCIGILVPGPESNDFYAGIVKGAQAKCRELGYEPLLRRVTAADARCASGAMQRLSRGNSSADMLTESCFSRLRRIWTSTSSSWRRWTRLA